MPIGALKSTLQSQRSQGRVVLPTPADKVFNLILNRFEANSINYNNDKGLDRSFNFLGKLVGSSSLY